MRQAVLTAAFGALLAQPAAAEGLTAWSVAPLETQGDDWTAALGGVAGGTVSAASGPAERAAASLSLLLQPRAETTLDNGWEVGLRGAVLAYHDRLAGDLYGDRSFEKSFVYVQTPYGRFEAGEDDGAAFRLGANAPSIDPATAIDGATTTFFHDPRSGRALIDMFRLQSAVFATGNDAKFTYVSPRWHGFEAAGSIAPYDAHGGLPFVSRGADRQTAIVEAGANYQDRLGSLSYTLSAGGAEGQAHDRATRGEGLRDYGVGFAMDDSLGGVRVAFGGAWRQSNAHAFDLADVIRGSETRSWRLSATASQGPFGAGFEYAAGTAGDAAPSPLLHERGLEASLGYTLNADLQLTAGWQGLDFRRETGSFYNGGIALHVGAEFLRLRFRV